jgi:hypothetical protein
MFRWVRVRIVDGSFDAFPAGVRRAMDAAKLPAPGATKANHEMSALRVPCLNAAAVHAKEVCEFVHDSFHGFCGLVGHSFGADGKNSQSNPAVRRL